jgi:hypothetical protein
MKRYTDGYTHINIPGLLGDRNGRFTMGKK